MRSPTSFFKRWVGKASVPCILVSNSVLPNPVGIFIKVTALDAFGDSSCLAIDVNCNSASFNVIRRMGLAISTFPLLSLTSVYKSYNSASSLYGEKECIESAGY